MSEEISTIFEEVSQVCEQYKSEVPGGRRAWPRSVKERISELRDLGLSYIEISERSGIPVATMYTWRLKPKAASFVPVKVVPKRKANLTVTVRKSNATDNPESEVSPTVTVVTPSGFRIEGVKASEVAELYFRLERGGGR